MSLAVTMAYVLGKDALSKAQEDLPKKPKILSRTKVFVHPASDIKDLANTNGFNHAPSLTAYSGASCPLIPGDVVHRFRRKLSTDSGAMLSTFSSERNRWTRSRNEWTPGRNLFGVKRALGNLLVGFLLDLFRGGTECQPRGCPCNVPVHVMWPSKEERRQFEVQHDFSAT